MHYSELEKLSADVYTQPSLFITEFDAKYPERAKHQYDEGMRIGKAAKHISIACNSVWSALLKDGASLSSYEGIGYHAHTASLLRGMLDSGVLIKVYRMTPDGIKCYEIRNGKIG